MDAFSVRMMLEKMPNLPTYESLTVEFKAEWNEKKDGEPIKKTIVAFANTAGGDLYIGIDDDGNVVGITDISKIEERLASLIRDNVSPSLVSFVATERLSFEGKDILRVHVDPGTQKPYCLNPKTASGIYIRVGNTSSPASIDDVAAMVRASNPVPFEDRIAIEQDLTFKVCSQFCAERGLEFDPKTHLTFGFWNKKQAAYTNLAYLCSDQSRYSIVLIHFADDDKLQILDSDKVEGSIFELYEEATKFIAKSNYAWMEKPSYGNAERIDHFVIDPRVILEALVNMFAHRDYSKTRANLVHITPSFVELHSVGGLTEDLSLEDVVEHMATECRNPHLAHLFSLLNLMENRGSGFRKIRFFYKNRPISDLLSVSETSFTIKLPRKTANLYLDRKDYREVVDILESHQTVSRRQVQDLMGISQTAAINLLKNMIDAKVVESKGGGRNVRYQLKNP